MLLSARQAAQFLGIGRTTLYELIKLGAVTPVHIGRCVRFSMTELEDYVERLVGVRVEGEAHRCVAEAFADDLHVDPGQEQV